jgi:hypothetical protein
MAGDRWSFDQEPESLEQAVQIAVGGASACWDNLEGAGVFRSDRALEVSEALTGWIKSHYTPKVTQYRSIDDMRAELDQAEDD